MKVLSKLVIIGLMSLFGVIAAIGYGNDLTKSIDQNSVAPPKLKKFAKEILIPVVKNSTIIDTIKAQNGKKVSLDEIKKKDKEWIDAEDEIALHAEVMKNAAAALLKDAAKKNGAIVEAFAYDNQGANVAITDLTSDYWQGDEAKWTAIKGGGAWVGKNELDKSTNQVIQQIALPVVDESGNVIGGICFGIALGKI